MDIKLCCQKCGNNVTVEKMVFEKHRTLLIPKCGHMHVQGIVEFLGKGQFIEMKYADADFIQISGTNDWKQIAHHETITCEKCNVEVQGYKYCPKCNTPFPDDILAIVYP